MAENPSPEASRSPPGASILLAVGTETMRSFYTSFLGRRGYSVSAADSAETALELWKQLSPKPQLLIADLSLPGMSGEELADLLKEFQPGIRVRFIAENGFELIDEAQSQNKESSSSFVSFDAKRLASDVESALADA